MASAVTPPAPPRRVAAEVVLLGMAALFAVVAVAGAASGLHPVPLLTVVVLPMILVAGRRVLLAWPTLLGLILAVILFIPIRRYSVGGGLPIELEPYRIVIALVLACWFCALAADPAVRWRRTGLERAVVVFATAVLISLVLNVSRVTAVSDIVLKQVSFFASFLLVTYFVASVIDRGPPLDGMLKLLVGGGSIVAALSLIEWRTGVNMFNGLGRVIPVLHYVDQGEAMARGSGVRALGSAQHPIALGAALVMLVPVSVYLHRLTGRTGWLVCGGVLVLGAFGTGSRTAALMLLTLGVVFVWLKRAQTLRLAPALVPLLIVIQVAMPGTLGSFRSILQPSYIIQEQSKEMGTGSGRLADLGPSLAEWSAAPFFGQGFGTRIVSQDGIAGGAQILDNQWLTSLLEIGAIGVLALAWLFAAAVRRLARIARADSGPEGWLAVGLAASLSSFAVGMFTFDAFAFIQVTFLAFFILGFAATLTTGYTAVAEERDRSDPVTTALAPLR